MKAREPKVFENVKTGLFIKASKTSQVVNDVLKDLASLKKPYGVSYSRKNDIHPFQDEQSIEFFAKKTDASLFMVGSHSKKRPHVICLGRLFDGRLLDMMELSISEFKSISSFQNVGCGIGQKPLFVFSGPLFETSSAHQQFKSLILDYFRGDELKEVALNGGLEHVISCTAVDDTTILFRVYSILLKKSGQRIPRVELEEMGPRMNIKIGRIKMHDEQMWRQSMRKPKEIDGKKVKNVKHDDMGDKFGRIHVGKQNLDQLQTRKMKGLKRGRDGSNESDNEEDLEVSSVAE